MPEPLPERIGPVRIERLAGEGGMGTVYVGFDERLERRVAVKTLRRDHRLSPEARARLLREARLLSRLDHPGICRIYDLIEAGDTDVLMLEYVEGRPLSARRPGELPRDEALRIGEALADALAAAHREGIVHRDLKPENVMLTPQGGVKVLDFGIARSMLAPPALGERLPLAAQPVDREHPVADDLADRHTLPLSEPSAAGDARTVAGSVIGTLGYMSPEQARGEEATPASDVFCLGLLLQELLTGRMAFFMPSDGDVLGGLRRGETRPLEGVDAALASLVEEMKSPDPERRPTAAAVTDRLRALREAPRRRRQRLWRAGLAAGVVALVASAALVSYRLARPAPLVAPGQRARIALLPFHNATGLPGLAWVERGLTEVVAQTLDGHQSIDVVPVGLVVAEIEPSGVGGTGPLAAGVVERLRRSLGSPLVLQAEIRTRASGYAIAYRLYHGAGTPATKLIEAPDLFQAARQLARNVALRLAPEVAAVDVADQLSDDPYANLTYAMGLGEKDRAGPKAARAYFEVCLDRDPGFQWARLKLAEALHLLGSGADADALARAVLEAARLRQDRRLEAAALRRLGTDVHDRGDFAGAAPLLEQALAASRAASEPYEVVETLNSLATTVYRTGDLDRAESLFREVLSGARALDHGKREAAALNNLGGIAYSRGDVDGAERLWSQALALFKELENRNLEAVALGNLAVIASTRGDIERAEAYETRRLVIHRAAGDRLSEAQGLLNLAETVHARGDLDGARARAREGLAVVLEVGDRYTELFLRSALAEYDAEAGDLASAEEQASVALTLVEGVEAPDARVIAYTAVGHLRLLQGRRAEARRLLARAQAIDPAAASSEILEARLLRAEGRGAAALAAFEHAKEHATVWGPRWDEELRSYREAASGGG